MPVTPTVRPSHIESIQKKHVDMAAEHSGGAVPPPRGNRPAAVSPGRERNRWAIGKASQRQIRAAFAKFGTDSERKHVGAMDHCLTHLEYRECPEGHEGRLSRTQFCGNRLCPVCQKRRAILAKRKYRPALSEALTGAYTQGERQVALFATLTWPSVGHLAGDMVGRMWKDLAKLKRQAWWKSRVSAETWAFEWTFSPAFGHHPHAHGIILVPESLYQRCVSEYKSAGVSGREESARWWADNGPIPKPLLSAAWAKLTGAQVVDVRLIRPRSKDWGTQAAMDAALDETLKYPMKETDYLQDRELRPDELAEIARRDGEVFDREEALVELYRAIRGRRLSDVRGCLRGRLLDAMKAVETATHEELLHMDDEEFAKYGTHCTCCGAEYVERTYSYSRKWGSYFLADENPLGQATAHYDGSARFAIQADLDRHTAAHMAKLAGRAWSHILSKRRERRQKARLEA